MQQYFMPIYTTLVGALLGWLFGQVKKLKQQKKDIQQESQDRAKALEDGMAILLRKQLFEYYGIYEYQDAIPASEWEDIEETHNVYNRLGGNHTGDRLFDEMKKKHLGSMQGG